MNPTIVFVGPLPPPVHGFSNVCAAVLERLKGLAPVIVFDRADRSGLGVLKLLRQSIKGSSYLWFALSHRNVRMYMGLSGGAGQLFDLIYLLLARISGHQIYVHHHSFAYIRRSTALNRALFWVLQPANHIVLSVGMGEALVQTYRIKSQRIRVISNAAFFQSKTQFEKNDSEVRRLLRIGFLSNISFEKGFVEFFEVLAQLKNEGVCFQAEIAGPVGPDARARFDQLMSQASDTRYLGAVYDNEKDAFYQRQDVLLFPTTYENEAEPLVILEAMQRGVIVMACNRGAIAEVLSQGAGLVMEKSEFVASAVREIAILDSDRAKLVRGRRLALDGFSRLRKASEAGLEELLTQITC